MIGIINKIWERLKNKDIKTTSSKKNLMFNLIGNNTGIAKAV